MNHHIDQSLVNPIQKHAPTRVDVTRTKVDIRSKLALVLISGLGGACINKLKLVDDQSTAISAIEVTNTEFQAMTGFPALVNNGRCVTPPPSTEDLPMPTSPDIHVWLTRLERINLSILRLRQGQSAMNRIITYGQTPSPYFLEHGTIDCFTQVPAHYIPLLIRAKNTIEGRINRTVISQ